MLQVCPLGAWDRVELLGCCHPRCTVHAVCAQLGPSIRSGQLSQTRQHLMTTACCNEQGTSLGCYGCRTMLSRMLTDASRFGTFSMSAHHVSVGPKILLSFLVDGHFILRPNGRQLHHLTSFESMCCLLPHLLIMCSSAAEAANLFVFVVACLLTLQILPGQVWCMCGSPLTGPPSGACCEPYMMLGITPGPCSCCHHKCPLQTPLKVPTAVSSCTPILRCLTLAWYILLLWGQGPQPV